jgi:hypothetical protein
VEPISHFIYIPTINGTLKNTRIRPAYSLSQDGGLFCDSNGQISKPFPDQPYCVDGTGTVGAQNTLGSTVSFCQTVLPGNEAMLIPTQVDSWSQLAVPGISYWCSTSAEYVLKVSKAGRR